jgi:hypothetical protein
MGVPDKLKQLQLKKKIADSMGEFYHDPYGFVLFAYPWGDPGMLENFDGPDVWQADLLKDLGEEVRKRGFNGKDPVKPIRFSRSSGHGIGKSALTAWLVNWIMCTRPHCQGTITANTYTQLKTKTWAQVQHWTKMSIASDWFEVTGEMMYHKDYRETWFCTAQTCREENSEAFAGQHSATSTSFYCFDESSSIPDKIFEVSEGGLTDGEPMVFMFGNPTRNKGAFYRANFGLHKDRWRHGSIDSRKCKLTNKDQLQEWESDYGEDSDFFRVRVRGLPPRAGDLQFIANDLVYDAQRREARGNQDDPLIAGIDLARGGIDSNVIRFRRGYDAASIDPIKISGDKTQDSTLMVSKISDILRELKPDAVFGDETGIGGPILDRLRQLGFRVHGVQFGSRAPDSRHFANMRAFMWNKTREWLRLGSIDRDPRLEVDLTGPGFHHDRRDRLVIESKESMKKRGLASPDDGDALALTFAMPVMAKRIDRTTYKLGGIREGSWMS